MGLFLILLSTLLYRFRWQSKLACLNEIIVVPFVLNVSYVCEKYAYFDVLYNVNEYFALEIFDFETLFNTLTF